MRRSQRGLSLIEGLVAGALAVVMGFLLLNFIRTSLGAHRKGQLSRTAQAGARDMLALVVGELRSSAVPPLSPAVSSSVFWPGVWGPESEGENLGPEYPREVSGDPEHDEASHRLVYVRTGQASESDTDLLAGYALTELLVPSSRKGALERRVHKLSGGGLLVTTEVTGADSRQRTGWMLDSGVFTALPAPAQPDLVFDAGPDSRVGFRVSHVRYAPLADPGRSRTPELYDPGIFRVEVVVALGPHGPTALDSEWPKDEDWDVCRSEATEIRIPAVRSSR